MDRDWYGAGMDVVLEGPAGRLEALLEHDDEPRFAAVVCHPHPQYGGTLHNTVAFRCARALRRAGGATLRFNFRGAGGSGGAHSGEPGPAGEEADAAAARDHLARLFPDLPLWGAGFSFGARTIAGLAAREPRFAAVVLIGLPVGIYDVSPAAGLAVPTLALWGSDDEFGTLAAFERRFPDRSPSIETREIAGADHLFRGRTPKVEEEVLAFALRHLPPR